ncbi:hypothetical protein EJB05_06074, partial [Eragrostis curvula]
MAVAPREDLGYPDAVLFGILPRLRRRREGLPILGPAEGEKKRWGARRAGACSAGSIASGRRDVRPYAPQRALSVCRRRLSTLDTFCLLLQNKTPRDVVAPQTPPFSRTRRRVGPTADSYAAASPRLASFPSRRKQTCGDEIHRGDVHHGGILRRRSSTPVGGVRIGARASSTATGSIPAGANHCWIQAQSSSEILLQVESRSSR